MKLLQLLLSFLSLPDENKKKETKDFTTPNGAKVEFGYED